jgi:poly-beta-1,6-N-acetyl-D-glucosamine synthase
MRTQYLAVTPVYNEERFIGDLLRSVVGQSCLPRRWLLIDDGSSDSTAALIDSAARDHPWIRPIHLPIHKHRRPGGEAFIMEQLGLEGWADYDFIFRLDADITIHADHVQNLLSEFERDGQLGIASGALYEPHGEAWRVLQQPSFQPTGACRLYSRQCFEAIGGLESGLGWDTIDVTKALMLGFHTRNFPDLAVFHHRPMQSASGLRRGRINMGEAAYNAGYSPLFMIARALRHAFSSPWPSGGALMMFAYTRSWLRRKRIVADREVVKFVRRQQIRRLFGASTVWR